MVDGKPKHGIFAKMGRLMGFSPETVSRQWQSLNDKHVGLLDNHPNEEHAVITVANNHILFDTDHVGRRKGKYKYDREALRETIKEIPFKGRRTYCRLAAKLNLPVSTTHLLEKGRKTVNRDGVILKKTRFSLKPTLTEQQKLWQ